MRRENELRKKNRENCSVVSAVRAKIAISFLVTNKKAEVAHELTWTLLEKWRCRSYEGVRNGLWLMYANRIKLSHIYLINGKNKENCEWNRADANGEFCNFSYGSLLALAVKLMDSLLSCHYFPRAECMQLKFWRSLVNRTIKVTTQSIHRNCTQTNSKRQKAFVCLEIGTTMQPHWKQKLLKCSCQK